ncbi:MAG: hypothetical protein ACI9FB_003445 [Candidatus Azotimanducaceae bacterium]|jgi:hypothetical protein
MRLKVLVLCTFIITGCASVKKEAVVDFPAPLNSKLMITGTTPFHRYNISIVNFDVSKLSQVTSRSKANLLFAESSYMPVVLKNTLLNSHHWGAVRVLPTSDPSAELMVRTVVNYADAVQLNLSVQVSDSSGRIWIEKNYSDTSLDHRYMPAALGDEDPFQDLYNTIANDIYLRSIQLTKEQSSRILDMSMLRYAIALSPDAFESFLEDGPVESTLLGLPARNDPMYERVKKIRETEYRFIDVLDSQYQLFFDKMQDAYPYWREYSFELMVYNDKLESEGSLSKRRGGTWESLERVYKTYKEYKLNEDELRELSNSLSTEIKPTVAELDGHVIELVGSFSTQYAEWREILAKLYEAERK